MVITIEHLKKALDLIDANELPEGRTYNQTVWDCGTACCMHGAAVLVAEGVPADCGPLPGDYDGDPGIKAILQSYGGTPELMRRYLSGDIKIGKSVSFMRSTVFGSGVKVGNMTHIGENVIIGDNCEIGVGCYLCGQSEISPGIRIPPNAIVRGDITTQEEADDLSTI